MKKNRRIPIVNDQPQLGREEINNFKVVSFNETGFIASASDETSLHDYFEIVWIKNGKGVHQIDMVDHPYNGGVLFFLAPGQVHKLIQHKKSEGYVLKFLPAVFKQEKDFIDYIFNTCLLDTDRSCPVIAVPQPMVTVIQELFSRFAEEFNKQMQDADVILSAYLKILTIQIRRIKDTYLSKEQYMHKPQYDLFREFKIAVEKNYRSKHTVQEYAIHLNTQARTLNTAARKYSNRSALEIIHDRILLQAKRKLLHDSKSVKELSYELGFDDPAYFTRFFKKNVGLTPQYFKMNTTEVSHPVLT